MSRSGGFVLLLLAGLVFASGLSAQTVSGRVLDEIGDPISSARITLLDATDRAVNSVLSESNGNFSIPVRSGGQFRLRVERGGFAPYTTPPFELEAGEGFVVTLSVPIVPIVLDEIQVEATPPTLFRSQRVLTEQEIDDLYASMPSLGMLLVTRFPSLLTVPPNDPSMEQIVLTIPPSGCPGTPLFVVDGMPTSRESALMIRVRDVSSVEVLRLSDAARTAFYGFRGGCGVVEIKTRR